MGNLPSFSDWFPENHCLGNGIPVESWDSDHPRYEYHPKQSSSANHHLSTIIQKLYQPSLIIIYQLPSGKRLQFAIENGPVEIVDFPMHSMVDLSSSLCKRLPEAITV